MWWKAVCTSAGLLGLAATGAGAAGFGLPATSIDAGTTIQRVHSVDDVEEKLYRNGYYDIRLERATLPYSFSACKRGTRYHVHVNYYGDFVQVDAEGPCGRYGYRDDDGRGRHYGRYYYRRGY